MGFVWREVGDVLGDTVRVVDLPSSTRSLADAWLLARSL